MSGDFGAVEAQLRECYDLMSTNIDSNVQRANAALNQFNSQTFSVEVWLHFYTNEQNPAMRKYAAVCLPTSIRRVWNLLDRETKFRLFKILVDSLAREPEKTIRSNLIFAGNHVSYLDPPLLTLAVGKNVAYMAKQELFEKPIARFFLHNLGAFAVNREKLGVSTIKTAIGIKKTNWVLGLFPQGTREINGNMDNVSRGFAGLAKTLKCDILPVGIVGAIKQERKPFESHIKINIGEPIPYSEDTHEMINIWKQKITELTSGEFNGKD